MVVIIHSSSKSLPYSTMCKEFGEINMLLNVTHKVILFIVLGLITGLENLAESCGIWGSMLPARKKFRM
jgi:hypothetical protein